MDSKQPMALIIDDEIDLCTLMQLTLNKMQISCKTAYDVNSAKKLLASQRFDFCLTDLKLPDGSGLDIVNLINQEYPELPVAVITAFGSMDLAIEALKLGAFDFVNKPLELPRLRQLVENALKVNLEKIPPQETDHTFQQQLIGESQPMQNLRTTIVKLARSQAPVFLWGESGTGKEVVAKLIHELSPRKTGNFVPVNCGAIPAELMESEFFGHKRGSFTGANADKDGLFQQANGGTLFLDEVADLPLAMQVKLLRAIQEKKVRPVGSTTEIAVDIRLLSATHKNLVALVQAGDFRQDLYYRINVIELRLPTLNERGNDILLLSRSFLAKICEDWGLDYLPQLSEATQTALLNHHFAGNVRELRNILERAMTLCEGDVIEPEHLKLNSSLNQAAIEIEQHDINNHLAWQQPLIQQHPNPAHHTTPVASSIPEEGLEAYLQEQERQLIIAALDKCNWNRTKAAKLLNTTFRSLRYRMKKLDIAEDE